VHEFHDTDLEDRPLDLAYALGAPRLEVAVHEGIEFAELAIEQILQGPHILQRLGMGSSTLNLVKHRGGKSHSSYPMRVEGLDEKFTGLAAPG
jgi:hypothetical protein